MKFERLVGFFSFDLPSKTPSKDGARHDVRVPVHLHGPASVCLLVLRRVVREARHPDVWSVSNYPASVLALSLLFFADQNTQRAFHLTL